MNTYCMTYRTLHIIVVNPAYALVHSLQCLRDESFSRPPLLVICGIFRETMCKSIKIVYRGRLSSCKCCLCVQSNVNLIIITIIVVVMMIIIIMKVLMTTMMIFVGRWQEVAIAAAATGRNHFPIHCPSSPSPAPSPGQSPLSIVSLMMMMIGRRMREVAIIIAMIMIIF